MPVFQVQQMIDATQQNERYSCAPLKVSSTNEGAQGPKTQYKCQYGCDKGFDREEHMIRHERMHTGEKPFACLNNSCKKTFSRYDNMLQHLRTHENKKLRALRKAKNQAGPAGMDNPTIPHRSRISIAELCNP